MWRPTAAFQYNNAKEIFAIVTSITEARIQLLWFLVGPCNCVTPGSVRECSLKRSKIIIQGVSATYIRTLQLIVEKSILSSTGELTPSNFSYGRTISIRVGCTYESLNSRPIEQEKTSSLNSMKARNNFVSGDYISWWLDHNVVSY